MPAVVVTATRTEQPAFEVPASIDVVTIEDTPDTLVAHRAGQFGMHGEEALQDHQVVEVDGCVLDPDEDLAVAGCGRLEACGPQRPISSLRQYRRIFPTGYGRGWSSNTENAKRSRSPRACSRSRRWTCA